jgi:hypothetical protein
MSSNCIAITPLSSAFATAIADPKVLEALTVAVLTSSIFRAREAI